MAVHYGPQPYAARRGKPRLSSVALSNRLGPGQEVTAGARKGEVGHTGRCPRDGVVFPDDWQRQLWASPRVPGRKLPNLSLCGRRKGRKQWPGAVCPEPRSKGSSRGCAVTAGVSGSESSNWTDGGREAPTFPEQHFRGDVIRGPHQGVRQAPLMLLPGPLLQRLQPVPTTAVGHVAPQVPRLHAVLSDVAPCQPGVGWENRGHTQGDPAPCDTAAEPGRSAPGAPRPAAPRPATPRGLRLWAGPLRGRQQCLGHPGSCPWPCWGERTDVPQVTTEKHKRI